MEDNNDTSKSRPIETAEKGPCTGEHCTIERCSHCRISPECPVSKVETGDRE